MSYQGASTITLFIKNLLPPDKVKKIKALNCDYNKKSFNNYLHNSFWALKGIIRE